MTRRFAVALPLLVAVCLPNLVQAQGFRIPEIKASDLDPTNPNGGIRKEIRNLDKARLDAMSRSPRAGRDYTKVFLKNDTRENISVAIRLIPFEVKDGNTSTLAEYDPEAPWKTLKWYTLKPGERNHVANTNNTILYTYAKSISGKEWLGSHSVNIGTRNEPSLKQFKQKYIGIDVPEEWTFSFSSRADDEVSIEYTLWNKSGRDLSFRLPSGKTYKLKDGAKGSYRNKGVPDALKIHVFDSGRDYTLTGGNHKFFWIKDKNRVGLDLRYDKN